MGTNLDIDLGPGTCDDVRDTAEVVNAGSRLLRHGELLIGDAHHSLPLDRFAVFQYAVVDGPVTLPAGR